MEYLKPLIERVIDNDTDIKKIQQIESDDAIYKELIKLIPFNKLADSFQRFYGVSFVNLEGVNIDASVLEIFDTEILSHHGVLPYRYDSKNKIYYFAITDILNDDLRQNVGNSCEANEAKARFSYALPSEIAKQYEILNELEVLLEEEANQTENEADDEIDYGNFENFNVSEWVNGILDEAIKYGASDIHIETLEENLQLRFRIDGAMSRKKVYKFPKTIIGNIFVRIKVISGMDISERRKPQDGRIDDYDYRGAHYDLRVSTLATINGEKCVMRLLDKSSDILSFEQLGFSEVDAAKVRKMLRNKNGIIYIAGATGSGKTTTLYTMIDGVNNDSVNIYTIENPVEKTIENVNQIQIDQLAGITYVSTLRALLRQDPDIIVVGEIRDAETTELSVQASLTGHLVISTIHANSAIDSVSRLLNMGVEPYLIVGSSLGFLSQRLVRKLCDNCKTIATNLEPHEEAWLKKIEDEYQIEIDRSHIHHPRGCDLCTNGYKGRVAIVEIIEMSDNIGRLILEGASLQEIEAMALSEGFTPLEQNGAEKAQIGATSIDELIKELS